MMMGWGWVGGARLLHSSPFLKTRLEFTSTLSLVRRKGRGAVVSNGNQKLISARLRPIGALFLELSGSGETCRKHWASPSGASQMQFCPFKKDSCEQGFEPPNYQGGHPGLPLPKDPATSGYLTSLRLEHQAKTQKTHENAATMPQERASPGDSPSLQNQDCSHTHGCGPSHCAKQDILQRPR